MTPLARVQQSQNDRRQKVARFRGGPLNGREMAVNTARPLDRYEVPIHQVNYALTADFSATMPMLDTFTYTTAYTITNSTSNIVWQTYPYPTGTGQANVIDYYPASNQTGSYPWWSSGANSGWGYRQDYAVPQISQEEADRRMAENIVRRQREAVVKERAIKRGRRLLLSLMDDAQRAEYARTRGFTVVGANGVIYRLRKGGTVHEMGLDGTPVRSHCIHLPYTYIHEDSLIALKLMLETDVDEFLRIANSTTLSRVTPTPAVADAPHNVRFLALARAEREARARRLAA